MVHLLDYVEQVVRLDERVAFRLADYRLQDGAAVAIRAGALAGLPGVTTGGTVADAAAWLMVERLPRHTPPPPPDGIARWIGATADPDTAPVVLPEILETVTATERAALLAADRAAEEDFAPAPANTGYDLRLRLDDQGDVGAEAERWIATVWRDWAAGEALRRRTIAVYGQLYRLQQLLELGGGESPIEVVWGIGTVRWNHDGRPIDRPLIECMVDIELEPDGRLTIRSTGAEPRIDLKPYEAIGAGNLGELDRLARAEFARAEAEDGLSPFRPDSFEPLLKAAATRLAANGLYRRDALPHDGPVDGPDDAPNDGPAAPRDDGPVVTGDWVLYARPRSQHVVLDDIARFRAVAQARRPIGGLAARLVTPPSDVAATAWEPLADRPGAPAEEAASGEGEFGFDDVFFPKPFNDDQVAIVRRLAASDGLVVQGPPGTGKTHTIANIVCHAMALGQRVLVVSRGEAALSVLRDQLPEKVRPLAIALLSSERQGMRQVEGAIREIQAVVEESRPEIRQAAIRRCEAEIVKIRQRLAAIDSEVDGIAALQSVALGPKGEGPAELARWAAAERGRHPWFDDAPEHFAADVALPEAIAKLAAARAAVGDLLDHIDADLPPPDGLPSAGDLAGWHGDLLEGERFETLAATGPVTDLGLTPRAGPAASELARALADLADAADALAGQPWLAPLAAALMRREASGWTTLLQQCCDGWRETEAERARLAALAVHLPPGIEGDPEARAAVARAAKGERLWPVLSLGHGPSKERVAAIRLKGAAPARDADQWRAVAEALALAAGRTALAHQWRHLATEHGWPADRDPGHPGGMARLLSRLDATRHALDALGSVARRLPPAEALACDAGLARAVSAQLDAAAATARLTALRDGLTEAAARFAGADRTATMARQILGQIVGRPDVTAEKVSLLWAALLERIAEVRAHGDDLGDVRRLAAAVAEAGAPRWAARLRADPSPDAIPADWRDAWDAAAAEAKVARIDRRDTLLALAREREAADRRVRKLFVELVRERAFLTLERRLSPRVKSALVEYVRALGRLGKGTGKGAGRHRRTARDAMARCYDAVPCWIMPTWRVAEQFPAEMGSFDLVILDEASQSDVTELPALLRGRKILAVGDDRQVSPTAPFVSQGKVAQLRHHYLRRLPYATLLEPGESLYDLMRAVFPDSRLMLKEHFRCVEPIIRFSMGFYPETLIPLRVPAAAERLDPPLIDILVPHGARDGARKINRAEADVIVDEIAALAADPALAGRSVGVISLIGAEQAELVRVLLTERIGDEAMQRHRILCSDSAGFQGNERDVVFLSMVADRKRRTSLTMQRYEQRFNVAVSRARDRLVLVRSVVREDLADHDLKARLIDHFARPMPSAPASGTDLAERCDSDFERDMLGRLLALGYRVTPQVGAEGFRIDLVVEDLEGRRLAVECDGDRFHGPERWRDDMRRQRILERVGWRFWRCFASSFYRDPDGVMGHLVAALEREGIVPVAGEAGQDAQGRLVEHRVVAAPRTEPVPPRVAEAAGGKIAVGDRVVLVFPDRGRLTLRLTESADDPAGGFLSIATPLGAAVARAEEGDEIELAQAGGTTTRVLVDAVEKAA